MNVIKTALDTYLSRFGTVQPPLGSRNPPVFTSITYKQSNKDNKFQSYMHFHSYKGINKQFPRLFNQSQIFRCYS